MTSRRMDARESRLVLLCYDGSDTARSAIEEAGAVLGGGPALVLTVWESLGSAALRYPSPGTIEFGRDVRAISNEVVDALDTGAAEWAQATVAEGAEVAARAGFEAETRAHRALGRLAERSEGAVWQAVLRVADKEDSAVVVLGSRGRSGLKAALLGSVSYGVVHNAQRPVLIVPPRE